MAEKLTGELAAGTVEASQGDGKCRTCSVAGAKLAPSGHCVDVVACTQRRIARVAPAKQVSAPERKYVIELSYFGRAYYVQTFKSKPTDPNFNGPLRTLFQAILERGEATKFSYADAITNARAFGGKIVPL